MTGSNWVLIEDINHKLDILLEGQAAMAPTIAKINSIEDRVNRAEGWVEAATAAMKDISKQLRNHETRITRLEQAT